MRNGDVYIYGVGNYDGTNPQTASTLQHIVELSDNIESIEYSQLLAKVNNSQLIPGKWYRLIDYQCTTTQINTQATNNQFDILLFASSDSELNENARADHHEGDTYFSNCDLSSWEIKYCIKNDTNRFAWADSTNGKGVIYYMKDEWNNECPYDFKNIQFKRWSITACQKCPDLVVNNSNNPRGYFFGAKTLEDAFTLSDATYGEDNGWFFTFALKDLATGTWHDFTVVENLGIKDSDGNMVLCINNTILSTKENPSTIALNNIVFFNCSSDLSSRDPVEITSECMGNFLGNYCESNTFSESTYDNLFGNECIGNSISSNMGCNVINQYFRNNAIGQSFQGNNVGIYCIENYIKNGCIGNFFGNYCFYNQIGANFETNTLSNYCYSDVFGDSCYSNYLYNDCHNITAGQNFSSNVMYNNCNVITIGTNCVGNTFGEFSNNFTIGNECRCNSFGNNCQRITVQNHFKENIIENGCSNIVFSVSYVRYCIVSVGNRYITITTSSATSSSSYLRNIKLSQRLNDSTTVKTLTHPTLNDDFRTVYQPLNSQVISI